MGTIPDDGRASSQSLKEAALTMQQGGGIGYDFSTIRPKGAPVSGVGAGRLRAAQLHGRLGRHVPHDHVGRLAPRRHDGDDALRPSRHRGLHRRQVRPGAAAQLQPLGAGDRRLHGGGEGGRAVGADLRRQGLPDAARARALGPDHAGDLRLCRARRDLHRPHQRDEQPRLLRDHRGHQSLRRAAAAALRRLPAGLDQPRAAGDGPVRGGRGARRGGARRPRRRGRAHDGQRDRRLALPAAAAGGRGAGQAADRPRRHRARRRAPDDRCALRLARGRGGDAKAGCTGSRGRRISPRSRSRRRRGRSRCSMRRSSSPRRARPYGRGRARGDRRARHPQRAADLDRADRHDLALRRQRVVRHRAGLRLCLHAQGAPDGRLADRGGGRRLRRPALAGEVRGPRRCRTTSSNAQTLAPLDHLRMQAAAQKWVDCSISKTINCPEDISFEAFKDVYLEA